MSSLSLVLAKTDTPFGVFFALGLLAVFLGIGLMSRSNSLDRIRHLTEKLGGRMTTGSFMELPSIIVPVQGCSARIDFSEGKNPATSLLVRVPNTAYQSLKISPDGIGSRFLRLLGYRDIEIGDPVFDEAFIVQATPDSVAHRLFLPARRSDVTMTVRRMNRFFGFSLKLENGMLDIRVRECLKGVDDLRALVRTASELISYLKTTPPEQGIVMGEVRESLSGRCPICATTLSEPVVRCERCRSPHHRDCWVYLGRCATYGCEPRPRRRAA
ncbi:MAG TPA: RING finger protein [Planctomycetota bacterium]|nr:RING finger protein [Planctomycetota bacterium]